jgi:hypothetical protein
MLTSILQSRDMEKWHLRDILGIFNKAVYEDLLSKIDNANTILRTLLLDHSLIQEKARNQARHPWSHLPRRYQKRRKHAEAIFNSIIKSYWSCQCEEQHCIHLQLPTNPLKSPKDAPYDGQSQIHMNFSNIGQENKPTWTWTEVASHPWGNEDVVSVTTLSLRDNHTTPNGTTNTQSSELAVTTPASPIENFCSSLYITEANAKPKNIKKWEIIGLISKELDSSTGYIMHAAKALASPAPQSSLENMISQLSRYDRLHIAAGLACAVIQFCGNWLKSWWDSSDIHLTAHQNGYDILLDSVYLSWPLSTTGTRRAIPESACPTVARPFLSNNLLLPLGVALVELSLGKSLESLRIPQDVHQDIEVMRRTTALRFMPNVYRESGTHYGDAVESCFSWSSSNSLCADKGIEEQVFHKIISPLLRDLISFDRLV